MELIQEHRTTTLMEYQTEYSYNEDGGGTDPAPGIAENGIFHYLASDVDNLPWATDINSDQLDYEYYLNWSGQKLISPMLISTIGETPTVQKSRYHKAAVTLGALYLQKWQKEWETMQFEYDPIENYRMVETMTDDETVTEYGKTNTRTDNLTKTTSGTDTETPNVTKTRTDNLSHTKRGTDTDTKNLTDTTTPNLTTVTDDDIYGFNSSSASNANKRTEHATGTNSETHTGTDEHTYNITDADTGTQTEQTTGTDTTQHSGSETNTGTQTDAQSGSDTQTRNYELTRSGNIGVTTSQQMIESERQLWKWDYFYDIVFPDIDHVLTLSVY